MEKSLQKFITVTAISKYILSIAHSERKKLERVRPQILTQIGSVDTN